MLFICDLNKNKNTKILKIGANKTIIIIEIVP